MDPLTGPFQQQGEPLMDNRNPYHDYRDLPSIERDIEIVEESGYMLPRIDGRSGNDYVYMNPWIYCHYYGFNRAATKELMKDWTSNYCPSMIWRGELLEYSYNKKGKIKKDGTPYPRKKGNPIYNPENNTWIYNSWKGKMDLISTDIQSFWEYCRNYRQVSTGILHNYRNVIVGDFDIPFTETTIKELEAACVKYEIPHFTYLEKHLDTEHYQIGWVLDEPIYVGNSRGQQIYDETIRFVKVIFGCDPMFRGWWIKNPNCKDFTKTYWFNDNVNRLELIQSIGYTYYTLFNKRKEEEEPIVSCPPETEIDYKPTIYVDNQSSRNCGVFKDLTKWYWDWYRNHGTIPTHKDTLQRGNEMSIVYGNLTHKGPLPLNEVENIVRSVETFFNKNFAANTYSKKQMLGNIVKGCEREYKILYVFLLREKGKKNKEIMGELDIKKDCLNKYIRYIKDNYDNILNGDVNSVIPNTMKLKDTIKTRRYDEMIDNVFDLYSNIRSLRENNK